MLSIGLPDGTQAFEAYKTLNEAVGMIAPAVRIDGYHLSRISLEAGVRWESHYKLRSGPKLSVDFVGGWPHLSGSSRTLALVVAPMFADRDDPLQKRLCLKLEGPWKPSDVPQFTEGRNHPVVCFVADGAIYQAALGEALQRGKVALVVQLSVLATSVYATDDASTLPQNKLTIMGQPMIAVTFPMLAPMGMLDKLDQIAENGPKTDVVVRGTVLKVEERQAGLLTILRDRQPDIGWSDDIGRFLFMEVQTVEGIVLEVACRPQDIQGEVTVGGAVHLTGSMGAELLPDRAGGAGSDTQAPEAWVHHDHVWTGEPLGGASKLPAEPPLLIRSEQASLAEPKNRSADRPTTVRSNLGPWLCILYSLLATLPFFLLTPLSLIYSLRWLFANDQRVTTFGRVLAAIGVLLSTGGVLVLVFIIIGLVRN